MPIKHNLEPSLYTVISGSFRKHLDQISNLKKNLEKLEICVLSPSKCAALNPEDDFIILESDPVCHPELLQCSVFAKMRRCSFLVLANFDGYIGLAAAVEIGYAIAMGLKIYSVEEVTDPNIAPFCTPISNFFPELQKNFSNQTLKECINH